MGMERAIGLSGLGLLFDDQLCPSCGRSGGHPERLSLLMKRVVGRQTRYVNALEQRSGTLWEGRYKSSPIQRDAYLLACCRYVELNPVRAGLVGTPREYRWSSYGSRAGWADQDTLDLDEGYLSLGVGCDSRSHST